MGLPVMDGGSSLRAIRILLIEDDPAVGDALRRAIERAGMQTAWATTGAQAMTLKPEFRPDVVLVDLELPDTNGVVLIKWLVDQHDCGVIVVSGMGDEPDRIVGLELGADDYVAKPPNMRELIARIRAVHRRTAIQSPPPVQEATHVEVGGMRIDMAGRKVQGPAGVRIVLTGAEFAALELLARARGKIVSRDQISEGALNRPWRPEDRSVDQLILGLRQKLVPDADGQSFIQSIRGSGYLLRMAPD